ncbi:MAG: aminomethyl-transferring glycine dehydrogenase subunit GcvPB [Phycisphaerae bacterium]|jgi:glycine dehydrogenase subunit 2
MKLAFEKSVTGRRAIRIDSSDVPSKINFKKDLLRDKSAPLPELSELDVVRHFTALSRMNFGVDTNFYPLGSCTMKYNPKVCERIASYPGFAHLHPLLPQLRMGGMLTQGALQIIYDTSQMLQEITGMAGFTMQPAAGAHGELTGIMIMAAYHRDKGNKKTTVLVPDSAHGTNPASAAIAGYKVLAVPSNDKGVMDVDALKKMLNDEVAGLMLTCPNTLGLFNPHIKEICDLIHSVDGLAYYDGANLNAIVGRARPGDFGFDIMHLNLHKTFATPHGGGGPGSGPVGVCEKLVDYLPVSIVVKRGDGTFALEYDRPKSIGYIAPFYGNFAIVLRAYVYMLMLGKQGLGKVADNAVLNANYVRVKLKKYYQAVSDGVCKHECVLSPTKEMLDNGVHALDIAKALIDRGFHPPTIYFPTIVKEAMMIEPTETESKETLDEFIEAMIEIAKLAKTDPEKLKEAPVTTPVSRPDETAAAKNLDISYLD